MLGKTFKSVCIFLSEPEQVLGSGNRAQPELDRTYILWRLLRGAAVAQGRAGWLGIRRLLVPIPAPRGRTELHVEVSLSKILNPKVAPDVQFAP